MPLLRRCVVLLTPVLVACSSSPGTSGDDAPFTSNAGVVLEFRFRGEVIAASADTARKSVVTQLQYLQGILMGDASANGQIGMVTLDDVHEEAGAAGTKRVTYAAVLPVVWPKGREVPASHTLSLPRDVTQLDAFNAKYDGTCGRNLYGQEAFWHDFNPNARGCRLDAGDVHVTTAAVAPHPKSTFGKYPEYDKVWEDDRLDLVAVFGVVASHAPEDEGVRAREAVLREASGSLTGAARTDRDPGSAILADSTVSGTVIVAGRARQASVTALLVDDVGTAGTAFAERYRSLSAGADVIVYQGHSGLGRNIRAVAESTAAPVGKYQIMYLYGCNSFAYLGTSLHDARIAANGRDADPEGTRFLDVIANARPSYSDEGRSTIDLYRAMLAPDAPKTYDELTRFLSPIHLAVVFGEHDNAFTP